MANPRRTLHEAKRLVFRAQRLLWQVDQVQQPLRRAFHASRRTDLLKPFLLADIGEGTRECQIIQWFVKEGARVEQFDKICEVQSDKTATDITSPFDGVIKKLYYEADDTALVGKPLVDIDIQSEITPQDEAKLGDISLKSEDNDAKASLSNRKDTTDVDRGIVDGPLGQTTTSNSQSERPKQDYSHKTLATPAVRHLTKELKVEIADIEGTGRDGRVLKEDVRRHVSLSARKDQPSQSSVQRLAQDRSVPFTPVQTAMFKTMTRSLTIPHFLYTLTVDVTSLTSLRRRLNKKRLPEDKLTTLPFILKAVSLAFAHHPLLNASLDTSDPKKAQLTYRASHNFGIAIDTPSGLLVPVVRNVQSQSVGELANHVQKLGVAAREGKLQQADMQGATFTVSNIGSIGGGVVSPIVVEPQVAIVGVGRSSIVPAFDEEGNLCKREELVLSWSADHRVVDGAECARAAERVKSYIEGIDEWVLEMN